MTKVYISSTYRDLIDCRSSVIHALEKAGYQVVSMEKYVATGHHPPLHTCLNDIRLCDFYIGIFAWRYGYIPKDQDNLERISITELEYREARKCHKPSLIFMSSDDFPIESEFDDRLSDELNGITRFRSHLNKDKHVDMFSSAEQLSTIVLASLSIAEKSTSPLRIQKIVLNTQAADIINDTLELFRERSYSGSLSDTENSRFQALQLSMREIAEINNRLIALAENARNLLRDTSKTIKDNLARLDNEREQVSGSLNQARSFAHQSEMIDYIQNIVEVGEESAQWLKRNRDSLIERTLEEMREVYSGSTSKFNTESNRDFKWTLRKYINRIEFSLKWGDKRLLEEPNQLKIFNRSVYLKAFQFIRDDRICNGRLDLSKQVVATLLEYFDYFIHQLR